MINVICTANVCKTAVIQSLLCQKYFIKNEMRLPQAIQNYVFLIQYFTKPKKAKRYRHISGTVKQYEDCKIYVNPHWKQKEKVILKHSSINFVFK